MARISENQASRGLVQSLIDNKSKIEKYSSEVSSGLKVVKPGDSDVPATISQYRQSLDKIAGYKSTIENTKTFLQLQDDVLSQTSELLIKLKELASQGADGPTTVDGRSQMGEEVFQIRDQLVALANTTFQGRYVYGGGDDDDPPFDAATYASPSSGAASQRYVFDAETGTSAQRSIQITDSVSITTTTSGNTLFTTAIQAAERLGRALKGYDTTPSSGTPDGNGAAFNLPSEELLQVADIRASIDLFDTARTTQILPERASLGGRINRLDNAASLLDLSKATAEDVLGRLQNADEAESASNLTLAQNALQASYNVTARVLRLSILDYI